MQLDLTAAGQVQPPWLGDSQVKPSATNPDCVFKKKAKMAGSQVPVMASHGAKEKAVGYFVFVLFFYQIWVILTIR